MLGFARSDSSAPSRTNELQGGRLSIDARIRERLLTCFHAPAFRRVTWRFRQGTLELAGTVPSFYLKQLLQSLLQRIETVERITNDVDVVYPVGLVNRRSG